MLAVIMLPNLAKVWIVADFKIHQDRIAKTLCVKKNQAHNTCNGSCHLKKQLDKVDEHDHDQKPSESAKKLKEVELFSEQSITYIFEIFQLENIRQYQVYFSLVSDKHIFSVFQPPRV